MNKKRLLVAAVIAVLSALFFYFQLYTYLTIGSLKSNRDALAGYYARHQFTMVAIFIAAYIAQTALSLPGASILSLAAGAIFGVAMGTLYVNIGATIGATLAFLVARYLFHDMIRKKFGSRLDTINGELETRGFNYLLFLRLVPVFPFFLINLGSGLTNIPLRTFFLGTLFGIIPGSLVYCNAGASLASITSLNDVASPRVLGSFAVLGLFALVPALYQKFKRKKEAR
jgi:uncharacterized membrane protein YdjX (TVP38/TMEM64 family)